MVSDRPAHPGAERGQILLVGAVALAVLVLALVPVYNAVFTTDSTGVGDPEGVPDAASGYEREALAAAQRIAIRTGHGAAYADPDAVTAAFEPAFANYTRLHDEAAVTGTGTAVNVTFVPDAPGTRYGVRVVQNRSGSLDKPTPAAGPGPANWFVVRPSARTRLGWFAARLDVSNLSDSSPLVVAVDNGTHAVELAVESDGGSSDVSVRLTGDVGEMSEDVTCDSRAGEIVIDLRRGSADGGDCTFSGLDVVEGPVSVRIRNGSSASGVYELVLRDGTGLQPTVGPCTAASPSAPCSSPTLWQLSMETRLRTERTDYRSRENVSVYGGAG
ncbi:MAG: hypothetical protein V5A61_04020 [Haloarculaceae archaeon]